MLTEKEQQIYDEYKQIEPEISVYLVMAVVQAGVEIEGFRYRLKSLESIEEKLRGREEKTEIEKLKDICRYTCVLKEEDFIEKMNLIGTLLINSGMKNISFKNSWQKNNTYIGLNTVFEYNGKKFEVQFHTEKSLKVKEKNHKLYEIMRVTEDAELYGKLNKQCIENNKEISIPKGLGKTKQFTVGKEKLKTDKKIDVPKNVFDPLQIDDKMLCHQMSAKQLAEFLMSGMKADKLVEIFLENAIENEMNIITASERTDK